MTNLLPFIILIAALLAGCAPVQKQDFDLSRIQPEHAAVYDVRACGGVWICWPWIAPHKLIVWRGRDGQLHPAPEAAGTNSLSALADPVESAIAHFNYGLTF